MLPEGTLEVSVATIIGDPPEAGFPRFTEGLYSGL